MFAYLQFKQNVIVYADNNHGLGFKLQVNGKDFMISVLDTEISRIIYLI